MWFLCPCKRFYPLRKLTPEIFWQATEVALEVMMGGKPEQGACTSAADLPQITNVVRHMQKMTWQAQGVARGARTGEVAGNRYASLSCIWITVRLVHNFVAFRAALGRV